MKVINTDKLYSDSHKEKVLVTGAAGFIGFHMSMKLIKEGFQVVGFDNLNDYYDVKLKIKRLDLLGIDINNFENQNSNQSKILENFEFV